MKSVHCIYYVISQYLAAEPVDNSNHKCSMTGNRRVSNVRTPYLIRTLYLAFAQKIREFLMFRMRFRGVKTRTWIDRSQIQRFLQSAHPFVIHFVTAAFQFRSQTGNSVKWRLHINLHHFVLDPFVGSCPGNLSLAFVIKARMRNLKQLQLTIHA